MAEKGTEKKDKVVAAEGEAELKKYANLEFK
jgi:hypothetical protein